MTHARDRREKMKIRIKKDDKVKVIAGKDKDKVGKVLSVDREKGRLVVEKVNMVKRHTKPDQSGKGGGVVEKEGSTAISNVMLMCNKCLSPSRVRIKTLDDGKKARLCVKCNEIMD